MLEINQIHHGDCLELMQEIPDGSVDMVLADLPYGTTKIHWDSIIDLDLLWGHYKRIIKPRGAIALTASQPFTSVLVMSNLEWFKYELVWDKKRGVAPAVAKYRPIPSHESILVFGNSSTIYHPQMQSGSAYKRKSGGQKGHYSGLKSGFITNNKGERYPLSVIPFQFSPSKTDHNTQKPVALFAYLINTYSNPGDLILDNAAGSGTTAIAAIKTGRNWLCIEKDAEIYQTAANRIAKAMGQGFTPAARAGQPNNQNQTELLQRGLWE